MGWGTGIRELDYTGFSSHSALSAAFWSIFLWLLSARFSSGLRKAVIITGYVVAAVVGYSRLVIHAHSVSEVIANLLLMPLAALCFCCCKTYHSSGKREYLMGRGCMHGNRHLFYREVKFSSVN